MKSIRMANMLMAGIIVVLFWGCSGNQATDTASAADETGATTVAGQAKVNDDDSMKDVVKVAAGSPDHTTLVAAVTAAELLDDLSNVGPFTVFAPTNDAFAKLPAGTVEGLLKPEKKADLQNILQYHVTTSMLRADFFEDGQELGMANGGSATITVKDGKVQINGANIIATVPASNGIVHVIDAVLLPK
jgi:uncharacterized surface protein with fasciclin (FAS1) repeats